MVQQDNVTADVQAILGGEAVIPLDQKAHLVHASSREDTIPNSELSENSPTKEELSTLRRVPGKLPTIAYLICAVEFAERASYYGCKGLFTNYVNRVLPVGGNGSGAPPRGTQQTAGALGLGTVKATATSQSFSMLAYALPLFFGWLSDTKVGRWRIICWGVAVCGVAHVLMVISGAPSLLANGTSKGPFFLSVYTLSIGAAMFKPNISPTLLDQMPNDNPTTKVLKSGEKVIVDPEATSERVLLWFYLLVNVGGFMAVPTSYTEKYIGWWLSFLLPLILYLPLPALLWYIRKRIILYPPAGSDLVNVMRVVGVCMRRGGLRCLLRRKGPSFFDAARPSVIATSGHPIDVPWNDGFVDDVRRTFQATGIFCFFPIQVINDNGLGNTADALTTMLTTNGVPNDVINNFNNLAIILFAPILNYGLYPLLRRLGIHYGPIARMTTGFILSTMGGAGYTLINYYAYKLGPCGRYGSSATCVDADGVSLVSNISIWWMAIPYALGGISELFVNVPAYAVAYSMAPKNMRSLVTALNLFSQAIAYAFGLAFAGLIRDPFLTWDFGGPTIVGLVSTIAFWIIYKDLDKEEYRVSTNGDYHNQLQEGEVVNETSEGEKKDGGVLAPEYENEKLARDKDIAV